MLTGYKLVLSGGRNRVTVFDEDGNKIGSLENSEDLYIMYLYEHPVLDTVSLHL